MNAQEKLAKLVDCLKKEAKTDQAGVAGIFGCRPNYLSELINGTKPITLRFVNGLKRKGHADGGFAENRTVCSMALTALEPGKVNRALRADGLGIIDPLPGKTTELELLEEKYRDLALAYVDLLRSKITDVDPASIFKNIKQVELTLKEIGIG